MNHDLIITRLTQIIVDMSNDASTLDGEARHLMQMMPDDEYQSGWQDGKAEGLEVGAYNLRARAADLREVIGQLNAILDDERRNAPSPPPAPGQLPLLEEE